MICFNSAFSYTPSRRTTGTLSSFVSFFNVEFLTKCLMIRQGCVRVREVCMARLGACRSSSSTAFPCSGAGLRCQHESAYPGGPPKPRLLGCAPEFSLRKSGASPENLRTSEFLGDALRLPGSQLGEPLAKSEVTQASTSPELSISCWNFENGLEQGSMKSSRSGTRLPGFLSWLC